MTPEPAAITAPTTEAALHLLRRVGLFDAIMIVMGGIVGAGTFINRYVVARQVHMPVLILAVRVAGGVVAMLGAFVYAELAARIRCVWVLCSPQLAHRMWRINDLYGATAAHPAELISVIALDYLEKVAARA
jgi:hypothetical protein